MTGQVHPRISVSEISAWNWSLEQDISCLKQRGVGAIGILSRKVLPDLDASMAMLKASGLAVSCVASAPAENALLAMTDSGPSAALRTHKPAIDLAAVLGRPCYFTSGVTPLRMPTDEAFNALVEAVQPVIAYAAEKGVRLALEHSNPSMRDIGFVNSLRDSIEFTKRTGIGIDLEIQNCWVERELPQMFRESIADIVLVQLSDYLIGEPTRMNRRVLGDGSIPLEWIIGRLFDAGYAGYLEIEILGPAIEAEGYDSSIARSIEWLNERLVKWGI
jgi:sugar phosphate isomerase/epimerase